MLNSKARTPGKKVVYSPYDVTAFFPVFYRSERQSQYHKAGEMVKQILLRRMNKGISELDSFKQQGRNPLRKAQDEFTFLSVIFENNNNNDMSGALKRIVQRLDILDQTTNINQDEAINELKAYSLLLLGLIESGLIPNITVSEPLKAEYVTPVID